MSATHESDEVLLHKLRTDCPVSFRKLYDRYNSYLYTRLLTLVKSDDLAVELLQDVFVKVWEKRQQLTIEKAFKPYLLTIARNVAMDFFRKAAREKRTEAIITNIATEYYVAESVDTNDELATEMTNIIDMLPPQRKRVFTLCKMEGKSYQEVSELMGISISTINDHIVKGTRFIREQYTLNNKLALLLISFFLRDHIS